MVVYIWDLINAQQMEILKPNFMLLHIAFSTILHTFCIIHTLCPKNNISCILHFPILYTILDSHH